MACIEHVQFNHTDIWLQYKLYFILLVSHSEYAPQINEDICGGLYKLGPGSSTSRRSSLGVGVSLWCGLKTLILAAQKPFS